MNVWPYPERRRGRRIFIRMPIALVIDSEGGKATHNVVTRDFSLGGVRVRTGIPLWPCQRVEIKLGNETRHPIPSRVAWIHAAGVIGEVGLAFFGSPPSAWGLDYAGVCGAFS
jgi:hypothetical protein